MIRQLTTLSLAALVAGCAIQKAEQPPKPAFDSSRNPEWLSPDIYPNGASPEKEPVVRYGRYTLVSTQPDASQRDLMAQIIDVTIPSSMNPSVRDAMLYVVDRSGYALCPPSSQHVNILYTRPLPAAQYKLGPMTLRNTLQVLAGPAWQVKIDEVNRQVCFALRPGYQLPEPSAPARQLYASNTSTSTPAASLADPKPESVIVAAVPAAPAITTSTSVASTTATAPQMLPPVAPPAKDGSITSSATSNRTQTASSSETRLTTPATNTNAVPGNTKDIAAPARTTLAPPSTEIAKSARQPMSLVATPSSVSTLSKPQLPEVKAPPRTSWHARVEDKNIRHTLQRWAVEAGWTFDERAHWDSPFDIPITANASFNGDFKTAVRGLVGATELSETPLQPCFYSNNVIRVVNYNVTCDSASGR